MAASCRCVDTLKSRVAGLETLLASTEERAAADRSTLQRMTKEHAQLQVLTHYYIRDETYNFAC